jgi:hypothetical protein
MGVQLGLYTMQGRPAGRLYVFFYCVLLFLPPASAVSLRGREATEAISWYLENKGIAALPLVARNDPLCLRNNRHGKQREMGGNCTHHT